MNGNLTTKWKDILKVCIFGATGSIGRAVCRSLDDQYNEELHIAAVARTARQLVALKKEFRGVKTTATLDVAKDKGALEDLVKNLPDMDAVIYTIGECPPQGFAKSVSKPLTDRTLIKHLYRELNQQVIGLQRVVSTMLPHIKEGGTIVVIGSAINRVTDESCPPWLFAGHYASAKACQKEMLCWMRRDPLVKKRRIKIKYLAPAAIDTPFHNSKEGKFTLKLLSLEYVTEVILSLITSHHLPEEYTLLPS